jgi:hypothetical protein
LSRSQLGCASLSSFRCTHKYASLLKFCAPCPAKRGRAFPFARHSMTFWEIIKCEWRRIWAAICNSRKGSLTKGGTSLSFRSLDLSCFRNTFHNFKLLPGAGGQPAGLAKMRRRFLRGPRGHLLYGVDGSHFAMYLQVLAQRARVPLRRQRDGCVALHFPPILVRLRRILPPGSTLNFSMLFLKHDTRASGLTIISIRFGRSRLFWPFFCPPS